MEQNLRGLFDRALDDEPHPPPGDLAAEAMASGGRMRRKRRLLAGSAAAVAVVALATSGVLSWQAVRSEEGRPPVAQAAAPPLTAPQRPGCVSPVDRNATEVSIFLTVDVTEKQRLSLNEAIDGDDRVRESAFENREQAYEKFAELWRDSPDFVKSVGPEQLPESFRVQLADPKDSRAFERDMLRFDGVEDVIGSQCP